MSLNEENEEGRTGGEKRQGGEGKGIVKPPPEKPGWRAYTGLQTLPSEDHPFCTST